MQDALAEDDAEYASKYELKAALDIGLGKSAADAVKAALRAMTEDPDHPDGVGGVSFKTSVATEIPLTRSSFGAGRVDKSVAKQGDEVTFDIDLDEKDAYLRPLPGAALYNVAQVVVYRSLGGGEASRIASLSASEGQRTFRWEWTPGSADVGRNRFWVFVLPKALFENLELEIKNDSKLEVKVSCPAQLDLLAPGQTETCEPPAGPEAPA